MENKKQAQENTNNQPTKDVNVIDVGSVNRKNGQYVCPYCGASEIQPNPKTGKLRCNYCFSEFDGKNINNISDISSLQGLTRGKGTENINADSNDVVTLKCGGCGAEVVIDTASAPNARCHWCRSILSINQRMENGAIPDAILPFKLQKNVAQQKIDYFVKKRTFFANPKFKKEFTTNNIMGVYFPYMLVDANCHAIFKGQGEHLIRRYTVGSGDNKKTRYDADLYNVEREFDILIDDLSIESSSKRLDKTSNKETNNIINSIMPFDTENCIQYESNYLVGYTSERRDVNIEDLGKKVNSQFRDISRYAAKDDATFYDRGIRWDQEDVIVKGTQWIAAYLPVWLYSYLEVKGDKKLLHYVAVNARTGETMGSIPINKPLLFLVSAIVEVLCVILLFILSSGADEDSDGLILLLAGGFVFYFVMKLRYRNSNARHTYEKETKKNVQNIRRVDQLVRREKGLSNAHMIGANHLKIEGEKPISKDTTGKKIINNINMTKDNNEKEKR